MATLTLARAGAATARASDAAVDDRTARPDADRADRAEAVRPDPGAEARDRRLARARGGDLDAFADLVRHHQRLVFGIACRIDRKSTRLNSSHTATSRMPSSA